MVSAGTQGQNQSSTSNSVLDSNTFSKFLNKSFGQKTYSNTSTNNPFVQSRTTNSGTTTNFEPNSAIGYVNDYVSNNIGNLINDYLNPSVDTSTNRALLENYKRNLSTNAREVLNNDIIAPLADRNMIRSSQATNLYSNLSNNLNNNIADYTAELLSTAQNQANDKLATLYNMYMNGYNVVSGNQAQSLGTSQGNGTTINIESGTKQSSTHSNQSSNSNGSSFGYSNKLGFN